MFPVMLSVACYWRESLLILLFVFLLIILVLLFFFFLLLLRSTPMCANISIIILRTLITQVPQVQTMIPHPVTPVTPLQTLKPALFLLQINEQLAPAPVFECPFLIPRREILNLACTLLAREREAHQVACVKVREDVAHDFRCVEKLMVEGCAGHGGGAGGVAFGGGERFFEAFDFNFGDAEAAHFVGEGHEFFDLGEGGCCGGDGFGVALDDGDFGGGFLGFGFLMKDLEGISGRHEVVEGGRTDLPWHGEVEIGIAIRHLCDWRWNRPETFDVGVSV
jgi:hypothetical protein